MLLKRLWHTCEVKGVFRISFLLEKRPYKCTQRRKWLVKTETVGIIYQALMGFLSCVDQIVFLQVGQLSETFIAGLTLKGSFTAMDSQVHLEIKTGKLGTIRSASNRCVAHICYSSKWDTVLFLTLRLESWPKVLVQTLHSYLIFPFCFLSG